MDQPLSTLRPLSEGLWGLPDEEFLSRLNWEQTASVPAALRKAGREGNAADFTRRLQARLKRLALRRSKRWCEGGHPGGRVEHTASSALWSRQAFDETARSAALAALRTSLDESSHRSARRTDSRRNGSAKIAARHALNGRAQPHDDCHSRLIRWIDAVDHRDPLSTFELLLLLEWLRDAGGQMPADQCFRLWRMLLTAILERTALTTARGDAARDAPQPGENGTNTAMPDHDLVVSGEWQWQAGLMFAELTVARQWREGGQRVLRSALLDQTDDNGFPRAGLLERLAFWIAPLVRARQWAATCGRPLWDSGAEKRFRLLVHSTSSLCRSDGRLALSNGFVAGAAGLLVAASRLAGVTKDAPSLEYLRAVELGRSREASRNGRSRRRGGLRPPRRGVRRIARRKLKKFPGAQSDWAQLACLRGGWSVDSDALVLAHHEAMPRLELTAFGRLLLSGPWEIAVSVDSTPLSFESEWTCTCWYSDADADYLELKTVHPAGVQVERQVLLAREDRFALFAETVSGPAGARIACASRLPLVSGAAVFPDGPSRECRLKANGVSARAFAPVLPSERVQGTAGSFGPAGDFLELRQTAPGGVYAPVVIDWNPSRRRAFADWRKLTVTEDGRILSSAEACGCRLRIGDDQWLFYRSLERSAVGRAVLGHHTHHETVISRFDETGEVKPILLVEYPEESPAAYGARTEGGGRREED